MKTVNISRRHAENLPWVVGNEDWMISIHSVRRPPANITAPFGKVFVFDFDDVHNDEFGTPIDEEQAEEIAKIIKEAAAAKVRCLWVHCDAGVCRSGAVVEAAKLVGFLPDDEISNERHPNRLVFDLVRMALGFKYSFENTVDEDARDEAVQRSFQRDDELFGTTI